MCSRGRGHRVVEASLLPVHYRADQAAPSAREDPSQLPVPHRRREAALRREAGEGRLHLAGAHFARMPLAVEEDEAPHPVRIGLLGAQAVMLQPDAIAKRVDTIMQRIFNR